MYLNTLDLRLSCNGQVWNYWCVRAAHERLRSQLSQFLVIKPEQIDVSKKCLMKHNSVYVKKKKKEVPLNCADMNL